jgi:hypothetical protein
LFFVPQQKTVWGWGKGQKTHLVLEDFSTKDEKQLQLFKLLFRHEEKQSLHFVEKSRIIFLNNYNLGGIPVLNHPFNRIS